MSLGEPKRGIFKGKGCLITGLVVLAAFIGITYFQQHQARKQFWEQMGRLADEMVQQSHLGENAKQQAREILNEMIAKGRDDVLPKEDQKRMLEAFLGSPCRLYMVFRRTEPEGMAPEQQARWRRTINAFLFAVGQSIPTKEESEALDKAAPPRDEYTEDNRMKPEHVDKIVAAFDAFFKGRGIDPATTTPFDYDQTFRRTVHRVAKALGHADFWEDAETAEPAAQPASASRPADVQAPASRPADAQAPASRPAATSPSQ